MKAKKILTVCLVFVLVATLVAAVACNTHTHDYSQWGKDDTQHWKVCPEDGEIDADSYANHSYGADGKCECGATKFEQPPHTHSYTVWDHNDTEHWKKCATEGAIDESSRANHSFGADGKCVCGATQGKTDPEPAELDDREFFIVGGGAQQGSLANASWSECLDEFKFTKAEAVDENGITVYTITLTLYSGDNFKIIQPTTIDSTGSWDDTTVLNVYDLDNATGVFKDGGGANITLETGKDGVYKFTVRTTKGGELKANKVEFELINTVPSLDVLDQYEMYIVGTVKSKSTTKWPSQFTSLDQVPANCYKLELQSDGKTFSVEVVLGITDEFKIWNYKLANANDGYYPGGVAGNLKVTKASTYVVSWVIGNNNVSVVEHEHLYTEYGMDGEQHWKFCASDSIIDTTSYENHAYNQEGNKCVCGAVEASACTHPNGGQFNFTASTVPTPQAEGGAIDATCPDCGAVIDGGVQYVKGSDNAPSGTTKRFELDQGSGYYYLQSSWQKSSSGTMYYWTTATIGFQVSKAGTYKITLTDVFGGDVWSIQNMWIDQTKYNNGGKLINNRAWNTDGALATKIAAFRAGLTIDSFQDNEKLQFTTMTLTITDSLLSAYADEDGILYVQIQLERSNNASHGYFLINFEVEEASAAVDTVSVVTEVAVLPRKEQF